MRRIVILEDHLLLAHSLALALRSEGFEVDTPSLSAPNLLHQWLCTAPPDLVLLDLELGDPVGDGAALIPGLVALGTRVLVVTSVTDRLRLAATLEAGADGFVCKSAPFDRLVAGILQAVTGQPVLDACARHELMHELSRHRRREQVRHQAWDRLTPRERQVLEALGEGKTVPCIADEWLVSTTTVRTQVRGVLTKLGVTSQLEAVAMARRAGWLGADRLAGA